MTSTEYKMVTESIMYSILEAAQALNNNNLDDTKESLGYAIRDVNECLELMVDNRVGI